MERYSGLGIIGVGGFFVLFFLLLLFNFAVLCHVYVGANGT